jgi:hypothetical protein
MAFRQLVGDEPMSGGHDLYGFDNIVAAIASVFTISYVTNLPGQDEDWLDELSIDMFPKTAASGFTARVSMA